MFKVFICILFLSSVLVGQAANCRHNASIESFWDDYLRIKLLKVTHIAEKEFAPGEREIKFVFETRFITDAREQTFVFHPTFTEERRKKVKKNRYYFVWYCPVHRAVYTLMEDPVTDELNVRTLL